LTSVSVHADLPIKDKVYEQKDGKEAKEDWNLLVFAFQFSRASKYVNRTDCRHFDRSPGICVDTSELRMWGQDEHD